MDFEEVNTNPTREKLFLLWNSVQRIVSTPDAKDSKLRGEHVNLVRRHYSQLLSNLNVPDVVVQMFQSGKLTAKEHEHLRQFHSTPIRASEELLNIIIISSRDVYECFLESLKKTNQHHVYQMLTSDEESIGKQTVSEHSRLIRQNYDWLTEKIDPDYGLLTALFTSRVISSREYEQIGSGKNRMAKNETLLSIISRKSVDDFKEFMIALKDTTQEGIIKRLKDTPDGAARKNLTTTVEKTLPDGCSRSPGKKITSKIPPKPKISPQTSRPPSTIQTALLAKPLLEADLRPSKPNRTKNRQDSTQQKIVNRSVVSLEAKLWTLQIELQTEVSTKVALIHQTTSKDSILKTCFSKTFQEILRRENECKGIKEDIQLEKAVTKKKLTELQIKISDLEKELNLTIKEKKTMSERLKLSEDEVENLKVLKQWKEQEAIVNVSIIERLEEQAKHSEEKFNEIEAQLRDAEEKVKETETAFKATAGKLKETEEKLRETEANLSQVDAKLTMTEKDNYDLRMEECTLKQTLEEERKLWAEEKDRLIKQAQELQKEFSDELHDKYNTDPVLVETIRIKARKKKKLWFTSKASGQEIATRGLTILDKELFVVSDESFQVEVYDSIKLSFSRQWNLKEFADIYDLVSCSKNQCLYMHNYRDSFQSKEILRVDPNGKLIKIWSTGDDWGWGLSVTDESNIILSVFEKNKLNEYSPDGQLIREINLSDAGIRNPEHAVKLTNGHFVVSHGDYGDDLHGVCEVDGDGKHKKSYSGKCGSSMGQMNLPGHFSVDRNGFVLVIDQGNRRVLLLDSDLKFKREILSEKHGLRNPHGILQSNGRLFVADNESNNPRILIFDFI